MSDKFDLIIFDCDGVVVDSEVITTQVLIEMCADLGLDYDEERVFKTFIGRSNKSCEAALEQELGHRPPESFFQDFHDEVFARYETDLQEVKDIRRLLDALNEHSIPFCLASSGDFSKIRKGLGTCDLLEYFEGKIYSAQEVEHGKPAPDLFLHAAKSMGYEGAKCLVIEDSQPGVMAAKAAHMEVIGFAERSCKKTLETAGAKTVSSMKDILSLLFD